MGWRQEKFIGVGFPMDRYSPEFYKINKNFKENSPVNIDESISLIPNTLVDNLNNILKKEKADPEWHKWRAQSLHDDPIKPNGKIFLIKTPFVENNVCDLLVNRIDGPINYSSLDRFDKKYINEKEYENQKNLIKKFLADCDIDIKSPGHKYLGTIANDEHKLSKDFYGASGPKYPYLHWLSNKDLNLPFEHYIDFYSVGICSGLWYSDY